MTDPTITDLPAVKRSGPCGLESIIRLRRSCRSYFERPLDLRETGQLLWAGQGIVGEEGERTVPSAGREYPLDLWLAGRLVCGLTPGLFHYLPTKHQLERRAGLEVGSKLQGLALDEQPWLSQAPAVIIISGDEAAIGAHFADQAPTGQRGRRYLDMEAGAAAQTIALQATALGLGAVPVGGFNDEALTDLLELPPGEVPLLMLAVGALSEEG